MDVKRLMAATLFFGGILLSFQSAVARDPGSKYDLKREIIERGIQKSEILTQEQKDRQVFTLRRHFERVKRLEMLNEDDTIAESDSEIETDYTGGCQQCE